MDEKTRLACEKASEQQCSFWVEYNQIKNEKGNPIEFNDHKFLRKIYDDFSEIVVVRKASQVGFSVMQVLKTFWAAKYLDFNIIYILPTFQLAGEFVSGKVNALISQNPILQNWTKDKDSIFQKKIGNGFIYYRGASSDKAKQNEGEAGTGIMISSDWNCMDESDRSDQFILEQYDSRLTNSEFAGKHYFSNPTHPQTLSQKLYEKSDQKEWFIKCQSCGTEQGLDFWKNVRNGQYVCSNCTSVFSDEDRSQGRWVKQNPNSPISGYHISHLICPWIPASKIQEEYETKSKQYFYNFVLGLPYIGSDVNVNRDIILRNTDDEPNYQEHNVMGCDSGLIKHYVIGNRQGIFKIGQAKEWADIEDLIKTYDIELCVIDALPDLTKPRELAQKYLGKVWLNYYKKEVRSAEYIRWDYKTYTVYSDRSKTLGNLIDEMVDRKIRFQLKPEQLEGFIRQWESVYKIVEKDSLGIDREMWDSQGDDHFPHAQNYWRIALERVGGDSEIKEWKPQDKIYTDKAPDIQQMIKQQYEE